MFISKLLFQNVLAGTIIVGKKAVEEGKVEVERRRDGKKAVLDLSKAEEFQKLE